MAASELGLLPVGLSPAKSGELLGQGAWTRNGPPSRLSNVVSIARRCRLSDAGMSDAGAGPSSAGVLTERPGDPVELPFVSPCCPDRMAAQGGWEMSRFLRLQKIGRGFASQVYMAVDILTNIKVALKVRRRGPLAHLSTPSSRPSRARPVCASRWRPIFGPFRPPPRPRPADPAGPRSSRDSIPPSFLLRRCITSRAYRPRRCGGSTWRFRSTGAWPTLTFWECTPLSRTLPTCASCRGERLSRAPIPRCGVALHATRQVPLTRTLLHDSHGPSPFVTPTASAPAVSRRTAICTVACLRFARTRAQS